MVGIYHPPHCGAGSAVPSGSYTKDEADARFVHLFGDESVAGEKTFTDNLIVDADLEITGAIVEDLRIEDNIIVLNYGETDSEVNTGTAGIEIDRGTGDPAYLVFAENTSGNVSDNRWIIDIGDGTPETVVFDNFPDDFTLYGDFILPNLSNSGILQVDGSGVLYDTGVSVADLTGGSITTHNNLSGLQGGQSGQYYHLTAAEYTDYIGGTEVANVTGNLQTQIDNIDQESTIIVGGDGILAVQGPTYTWTVSVSGDYATKTEVANVTGNLQQQIDDLDNEYVKKTGDTMTGNLNMNSANVVISGGEINLDGSILKKIALSGIVTNTTVDQFSRILGNCCFWDVLIADGTNFRASTVMAVWNQDASTVRMTETSTENVGDTDAVSLLVDTNVGNTIIRLRLQVTGGSWTVKAFRKLL